MNHKQRLPEALRLAEEYADAVATHRLENLYGTSRSYRLEKARERDEAFTALDAELRRQHEEIEALRSAANRGGHMTVAWELQKADEALLWLAREMIRELPVVHPQQGPRRDELIEALNKRLSNA